MIRTSTALMRDKCSYLRPRQANLLCQTTGAFVLIELIVVLVIVSLMTTIAMIAITPFFGNTKFKLQAREFINTLQLAQNSAAESEQRYEIELDFDEQIYIFRPLTTLDPELKEEGTELIEGYFTDKFKLEHVIYDDDIDTRYPDEGQEYTRTWVRAGHSGWQNGTIIVVSDIDENPYSIILNRLSRTIAFYPGAYELQECGFLLPVKANDLRF